MTDTSRSLTRYDGPRTTEELREYALLLAFDTNPEGQYKRNDALPVAFRGNPGAVAFAVEYGKALDVSPITALIGIHIVEGKPTASAGLISALVRRAGHRIRTWTEGTVEDGDLRGITTITREDDTEFEYRSTWTLERAVRAGLCQLVKDPQTQRWTVTARGRSGKPGAWETYTENMLKARSITEAARDAAEDAVLGVHYTPEELGVDVDDTGEPVYNVTTVPTSPPAAPATPTPAPQAPAEQPLDEVTGEQLDELALLILDAVEREELTALWHHPIIGASKARAQGVTVGDADGAEVTILDLFTQAGQALTDGTRDQLRARFGLVEVTEHGDNPEPDAGTTAAPAPEEPSGPTSDAVAPEPDEAPVAPEAAPAAAHGPKNGPEGPHLRTLNLTADRLTQPQRAALVGYVNAWQLNPSRSEDDAAKVCTAIATGQIGDLVAATQGTDPDPVELVSEAQLAVAREVEEAREEAREAAGATPPPAEPQGKAAAAAQARAAAREARENMKNL